MVKSLGFFVFPKFSDNQWALCVHYWQLELKMHTPTASSAWLQQPEGYGGTWDALATEGGASPLLTHLILLRGENIYFHVQFVWQKLNNNLKIIFIQKI